jgi:hypothetical protein
MMKDNTRADDPQLVSTTAQCVREIQASLASISDVMKNAERFRKLYFLDQMREAVFRIQDAADSAATFAVTKTRAP